VTNSSLLAGLLEALHESLDLVPPREARVRRAMRFDKQRFEVRLVMIAALIARGVGLLGDLAFALALTH
jgi:hypothetical protein